MAGPVVEGARVTLRPPRSGDVEARLGLGRDAEIARMFGASATDLTPLTIDEIEREHATLAAPNQGWIIEHEGRAVGVARLHAIDPRDQRARFAVGIYDPELLGRGLGTEVTRLVLAHAFATMQLHRVELRVLTYSERAIRCYEKCGFRHEGIERESALVDGEWCDDAIMAVLQPEWQATQAAPTGPSH